MGAHVQRGLVAVCHVEDYDAELIKKHEEDAQGQRRSDRPPHRHDQRETPARCFSPIDDAAVTALVNAKVKEAPVQ